MDCVHANLIKDSNIELDENSKLDGVQSTTYSCVQCGNMFTITEFKEAPPVYGTEQPRNG